MYKSNREFFNFLKDYAINNNVAVISDNFPIEIKNMKNVVTHSEVRKVLLNKKLKKVKNV